MKNYEKQGILEDGDTDHRGSADCSDNHAGCYQLYVKERRWADAQRFFVYNRKGVTRGDRAHLLL